MGGTELPLSVAVWILKKHGVVQTGAVHSGFLLRPAAQSPTLRLTGRAVVWLCLPSTGRIDHWSSLMPRLSTQGPPCPPNPWHSDGDTGTASLGTVPAHMGPPGKHRALSPGSYLSCRVTAGWGRGRGCSVVWSHPCLGIHL